MPVAGRDQFFPISPKLLNKPHDSEQHVQAGSSTLTYDKCGSGPAVIIVHGIGGHKEDWAAVAAQLASSRTVYAIDMPGFGASSKTGGTITIADQAAALVALMDAEKIAKADVIDNSAGGWVAATLGPDHPDRVSVSYLPTERGAHATEYGVDNLTASSNVSAHPDGRERAASRRAPGFAPARVKPVPPRHPSRQPY